MWYSSLLGSLPSIQEGWNSSATPTTNNLGLFIYNLFKFFRNMGEGLKDFFTATLTINGEQVSVWIVFGGTLIVVVLILIIAKKIIPLA